MLGSIFSTSVSSFIQVPSAKVWFENLLVAVCMGESADSIWRVNCNHIVNVGYNDLSLGKKIRVAIHEIAPYPKYTYLCGFERGKVLGEKQCHHILIV